MNRKLTIYTLLFFLLASTPALPQNATAIKTLYNTVSNTYETEADSLTNCFIEKFMNKTKLDTMDVTMPEGHNLLERFTQGTQAQDTRLMIQRNSTCYSVFQTIDTYEPLLVRRELQNVVDIEKVDNEKDEMPPLAPVKSDNLIIWNNDTMQYAIVETPYHYDGEKDFLRLINGKDMCWPFD